LLGNVPDNIKDADYRQLSGRISGGEVGKVRESQFQYIHL